MSARLGFPLSDFERRQRKLDAAAKWRENNRERIRKHDMEVYWVVRGHVRSRAPRGSGSHEHWCETPLFGRRGLRPATCDDCHVVFTINSNVRFWNAKIYHSSCLHILRSGLKEALA